MSKGEAASVQLTDSKKVVQAGAYYAYKISRQTVVVQDGKREETEQQVTVYTVQYTGDRYFQSVFGLTPDRQTYAHNLTAFLDAQFDTEAGQTHASLEALADAYPHNWTSGGFGSPFAGQEWEFRISSLFGFRIDPFTGKGAGHTGLDIAMPQGTPIKAASSGVVTRAISSL